jgi:hypothetical protein
MQTLDTISNDAKQKHTILLEKDNTPIVIQLTYKPTQIGWFLDVEYDTKNFAVYGLRVTTNLNILNQWRNVLPFGIICYCEDNQDPLSVEDFLVGRAHLAILNEDEVKGIVEREKEIR